MRWAEEQAEDFNDGDKRRYTLFLLFPKCIKGEWRWLEMATVEQVFNGMHPYFEQGESQWEDFRWVDVEDK